MAVQSQHLNQSLALNPLKEALWYSVPEIHHSDQGVQSLSNASIATLQEHGVEISVARRGRPWENGYAERLIRTLKEEEVHINDYQSITEASQREHRAFYRTSVPSETPTFGVRVSDTYGISTKNLLLTLLIFGLNKRWHFTVNFFLIFPNIRNKNVLHSLHLHLVFGIAKFVFLRII